MNHIQGLQHVLDTHSVILKTERWKCCLSYTQENGIIYRKSKQKPIL